MPIPCNCIRATCSISWKSTHRNARVSSLLVPEEAFNRRFLAPSGVFAVQQEYDEKYVIVPIGFAREILEDEKALTSYEIGLKPGADKEQVLPR